MRHRRAAAARARAGQAPGRLPRDRSVGTGARARPTEISRGRLCAARRPAGRGWRTGGLAADYCVINGLFTVKGELTDAAMWEFMTAVLGRLWPVTRKAIAFNVMSKQVDWERADLFHVSLDRMAEFLHRLAGRNVTFRADYGLFEYTCYVRKEARPGTAAASPRPPRRSDASMVFRPRIAGCQTARTLPRGHRPAAPVQQFRRNRAGLEGASGGAFRAARGTLRAGEQRHRRAHRRADRGGGPRHRAASLLPDAVLHVRRHPRRGAQRRLPALFLDIDPRSWALDPERLFEHPVLRQAGAIIVVAPYGQPIAQAGWQRLAASTGVPVVIDAAAGFDAIAADPAAPSASCRSC